MSMNKPFLGIKQIYSYSDDGDSDCLQNIEFYSLMMWLVVQEVSLHLVTAGASSHV
jgi:hypothetical protein